MNDFRKFTKKACIQCGLSPENILMLACDHSVCLECAYRQLRKQSRTIASQLEFKCKKCAQVTYFDEDLIKQIQSVIRDRTGSIKKYDSSASRCPPSANQYFPPSGNQSSITKSRAEKDSMVLSNPGCHFSNLSKNYRREESVIERMKKQYLSQSTTVGNSHSQSPMSVQLQDKQTTLENNLLPFKQYLEMSKKPQKTTPERTNKIVPTLSTTAHKQRNEITRNQTAFPTVKVPEPKQIYAINQERTPQKICKIRFEHPQFPGHEQKLNFNELRAESIDAMCQAHRLYELNYFCSSCSQIVCSECLLRGKHKEHENLSLLQAIHEELPCFISETSQILLQRVQDIQSKKHYRNASLMQAIQEVSTLRDQTLSVLKDLKKRIQKEEEQVLAYCQTLLKELTHEERQSQSENGFSQREQERRMFQLISSIKELKTSYQRFVDFNGKSTQMPRLSEMMKGVGQQHQEIPQTLNAHHTASLKAGNCFAIMQKYAHCRRQAKIFFANSQNQHLRSASQQSDKAQHPKPVYADELKLDIYHLLLSVKQNLLEAFQFWPKSSPKPILEQFGSINPKSSSLANNPKSQKQNQFDYGKYTAEQLNSVKSVDNTEGCTHCDDEQPKKRSDRKHSAQRNKQNISTENNSRNHSVVDTRKNSQIIGKQHALVPGNPALLQKSSNKPEKLRKQVQNGSKSHSKSKSKLNSVSKSIMKEVQRKAKQSQKKPQRPPAITKFHC